MLEQFESEEIKMESLQGTVSNQNEEDSFSIPVCSAKIDQNEFHVIQQEFFHNPEIEALKSRVIELESLVTNL